MISVMMLSSFLYCSSSRLCILMFCLLSANTMLNRGLLLTVENGAHRFPELLELILKQRRELGSSDFPILYALLCISYHLDSFAVSLHINFSWIFMGKLRNTKLTAFAFW